MLTVIYRWKLKTGSEQSFIQAWSQMTTLIRQLHGSLGSRLHRIDDQCYLAYAQWPDKPIFTAFLTREPSPVETQLLETMQSCIEKSYDHVELDVIDDQLCLS